MRNIPYFRLQKNKEITVREMFGLQPHENIKRIIITIHEDYPEGLVKCTVGNESKVITKEFAYFYGFDHLLTDNSNLGDGKLDCTIQALTDCSISITINLW